MKISQKEKQPSRFSRRQRIKNQNLNPTIMKNLMKKKPTSLRSSIKDQGSTKANYLSNVLIVARLGILHASVPIQRKILKMKETQINHSRKGKTLLQEKLLQREEELLLKRRRQQFK